MYNLTKVYAAVSLTPKAFNIVVSENANDSFNLLWSDSFANEGYYDQNRILLATQFKSKIKEVLGRASDILSNKIVKVIVSFEGLLDDLEIKAARTKPMTFVNKWNLIYKQINSFANEICATDQYLKNTNVFSWKVLNFTYANSKQVATELEAGKNYVANVQIYSSRSDLVGEVNGIFYSLGYQILKNSCTELDFHSMIKNPEIDKMVIDIQENKTNFATYQNGALISLTSTKFGEKNILEYILNKSQSTNITLKQVKEMISNQLNNANCEPINLICKTNDEFLNMGFVNTAQLKNLILQALSPIADALNLERKRVGQKYQCNIQQVAVYAKTSAIASVAEKLTRLVDKNVDIFAYKNMFTFLEYQYFLTGLTIMRQVHEDHLNKSDESCIEVFYSETFNKKFDRNLAILNLTKDVTHLVQKIIK
ncbi:MPN316 family protein [[Mycoplasma] testudinis]|uniref:MPN316 family protein n=1 Tax=[Mycoplasma] testudinis TaxID=33924 RepID=UPI00048727E9|nr:hypothetical protein [[Mycoplasma] testudinis]